MIINDVRSVKLIDLHKTFMKVIATYPNNISMLLILFTFFIGHHSVNAENNEERSYELFTEGKSLYGKGKYKDAESIFIKSLRYMQDHKTMYYRALAVTKNSKKTCEDRLSCWQNYLDFCNTDKDSNCVNSWLSKAIKHHQKTSSTCSKVSNKKARLGSNDSDDGIMKMVTSFQCQIKNDKGIYQPQRICNGEVFKEDDQVRFEIIPSQMSYLYVLVHNDSGQIQLVYPETNSDQNRLDGQQKYIIPSDPYFKGWWSIDDQKNVKERVTIILSKDRNQTLEGLKGINLKPEQAKTFLQQDPITSRSLITWQGQGQQKEVQGNGIRLESIGDQKKVITQYFFNHE